MTPEEVAAILEPFYDVLINNVAIGNFDKVIPNFDEDAVVIDNGELFRGHEAVRASLEKMFDIVGPHEYKVEPKIFDGCSTVLSAVFDFTLTSEKVGKMKGHCEHIWRKKDDRFFIVREDFYVSPDV